MNSISAEIASHLTRRRRDGVPEAALEEARTLVADYLGVAVRGSRTTAARVVARYHRRFSGESTEAAVLGSGYRTTAAGAAFCNAVAAHSLEMDDTDQESMLHFSAPVVSAALACAEAHGRTGAEFLRAVVVGCEVMQAVSDAVNPGMRDRGFHSTAVCGVFGAAAAAGMLCGLDAAQIVHALGAAGAHACGMFEIYGPTLQKALQPGPAAHNGIVAARLAMLGFTGADTVFDGRAGLFRAFTAQARPERLRQRLQDGAPLGIEYKPYTCFRPIHTAIDCAREIHHLMGESPTAVSDIILDRHPSWAEYHLNPHPRTEQEAKGSINYGIAVALRSGNALLEQYSPDQLTDPLVRRLCETLTVRVDPTLPRGDSCRLRVAVAGGRVYEARADYPKGSVNRPMSAEEHLAKFRYLTAPVLSASRAAELRSLVERVEELDSVQPLVRTARADLPDTDDEDTPP